MRSHSARVKERRDLGVESIVREKQGEVRNFALAAHKLGKSASAVGKTIARFEGRLWRWNLLERDLMNVRIVPQRRRSSSRNDAPRAEWLLPGTPPRSIGEA